MGSFPIASRARVFYWSCRPQCRRGNVATGVIYNDECGFHRWSARLGCSFTMTRKTRRPCPKRLPASLPLPHAIVLFGFPLQVSDRLRGLLLSTPPFFQRKLTSA